MRTGTATIDITPPAGADLCGFVARVQPSVGVHDRLKARGLFLDSGDGRLLWLHAELIAVDAELTARVKAALRERLGLDPAEVVLSATHTHAGPATVTLLNCGTIDPAYIVSLEERLVDVAVAAMNHTEETEMLFAEGTCTLAVDRRRKASAHTDSRVATLAWRRPDGTYAAVLANYAMHNVAMAADNRLVSGDIAGEVARRLAATLPGQPTVLLTNGACGNLNPPTPSHDFTKGKQCVSTFDDMEQWGATLADAITAAVRQATPMPIWRIRTSLAAIGVTLQGQTLAEIHERAAKLHAELDGQSGYIPDRVRGAIRAWEAMMAERFAASQIPSHVPLGVQAVSFAPVTFVCLGVEAFSRIADDIRAQAADAATYVVGYANGDIGYLAPSAAYDEGGYETDSAFVFYGGLPVQRGEFERVAEQAARLARQTRDSVAS
ncbi:MAG: neutral/alkaline non-lysosomal ceramidase N-terminal domain-containing protein [Phycisphaerae bacterium]|nr:neutral/alkaline non-lysosomal ceramidase N-terminal domain-containing protein [Phycisphaerae bacterium]